MNKRSSRTTKDKETEAGSYTLDPKSNPPLFWYTRTARGDERFTESTLAFFRTHGINPNNPRFIPESRYVTYTVSPYHQWADQNGENHVGLCTCKGFSVRKTCRHITEARKLLQLSSS